MKRYRMKVRGGVIETPHKLSRADKKRIRTIWNLDLDDPGVFLGPLFKFTPIPKTKSTKEVE